MEISALTNLVTAFRAETRQDSITPETLGSLLQRIVNVLGGATDSGDFQLVEDAVNFISGLGNVLVGLSLGADDRNNIYVIVDRKNLSTGLGTGQQLIIRAATTERAGAMKAQQVTDLNTCRNNFQKLARLTFIATSSATGVTLALVDASGDIFNDADNVKLSLPVASYAQAGIVTAADYKKFTEAYENIGSATGSGGGTVTSSRPYYHIECDAKGPSLMLSYPKELTERGYIPYLLRYTVKKSRYRKEKTDRRTYGPIRRGWHMFYGPEKMKLLPNSTVLFGKNVGTERNPVWEYVTDIRYLFSSIRQVMYHGEIAYKIGFGCRTHLITSNHRFRFGIVFAPAITGNQNTLLLSKAVTNIARFQVHVSRTEEIGYGDWYLKFSYSI